MAMPRTRARTRTRTRTRIRLRAAARWLAAVFFVFAGAVHLVRPGVYLPVMPEVLPAPGAWILLTGIAEIAGGVGLLVPRLRRAAAWGLIAMLVGFLWVHIDLLFRDAPELAGVTLTPLILWLRLPLQGVFIAWVAWVGLGDDTVRRAAAAGPA